MAFILIGRLRDGRKWAERMGERGMTGSKDPQVGLKLWVAAARNKSQPKDHMITLRL